MRPQIETPSRLVADFAVRLLHSRSLAELLTEIASTLGGLPGFATSAVYLVENGQFVRRAASGNLPARDPDVSHVWSADGLERTESATDTQGTASRAEIRVDPGHLQTELTVPILFDRQTLGALHAEATGPNGYNSDDLQVLQTIADLAGPRIACALSEHEAILARDELSRLNDQLSRRIAARTSSLRRAAGLLRSERDRLVAILDAVDFAVIAVDSSFTVRRVSTAAAALLGKSADRIEGHGLTTVFRLQDVDDLRAAVELSCDEAFTRSAVLHVGTEPCEIDWTANRSGRPGLLEGYVLVFRDMTHQNFHKNEAARVQRIESVGVLAAGIAHDFNNYLAAISASIDASRLADGDRLRNKMLTTASQACIESQRLTQELLTYSSGGKPVRGPVRVADIVHLAIALSTSGQRVQTCVDIPEGLPNVFADSGQMTQVLSNLLINAVQSMPDGGRITVSALAVDGSVTITVTDNGPGIPDGTLERLFEPYFTTRGEGTGLGLTTSYFIMRDHGGSILARNNDQAGAEFVVTIPASSECCQPETVEEESMQQSSLNVLVLDDEHLVRRSIAYLLKSLGHTPFEAESAEQAVRVVRESQSADNQIHAAIVDLTLGADTGQRAVRELNEISPETHYIVSSGYSDDPVMANYARHGFCGVLPKPYSSQELVSALSKIPR